MKRIFTVKIVYDTVHGMMAREVDVIDFPMIEIYHQVLALQVRFCIEYAGRQG